MAESFVSTFKNELIHPRRFRSRDDAELTVVEWNGTAKCHSPSARPDTSPEIQTALTKGS